MRKILFLLCLFPLVLTGCDDQKSNKKWGLLAGLLLNSNSSVPVPAQRTVQQPFGLYGHGATRLLNGDVLIVGGWDENHAESTEAYVYRATTTKDFDSPYAGFFYGRVSSAQTLITMGSGLTPAGSVLITGGQTDETDIYDPLLDDFVGAPDMDFRWGHTATEIKNSGTSYDGKILIVGGRTFGGYAATVLLFDPATKTFSQVPDSLRAYRADHTATLLADGRVLITGGATPVGISIQGEIFDPRSGDFDMVLNRMSEARIHHTATYLDHKTPTPDDDVVLIVGGFDENGLPLDSADFFDPSFVVQPGFNPVGGFIPVNSALQVPVYQHTATALPDTALDDAVIVGGWTGTASANTDATAQVSVFQYTYDPSTGPDGIFVRTNDLLTARAQHTTTHLDGHTLLIVGGMDEFGDALFVGEEYDY